MTRAALTSILATERAIRDLAMDSYKRFAVVAHNAVLPVLGATVAHEVATDVQSDQPVIPPDVAALVTAYALWDSEMDDEFLPGLGAVLDGLVTAALWLLGLKAFQFRVDGTVRTVDASEATQVVPGLIAWRASYLASVRERMTGTPAAVQKRLTAAVDRRAAAGATTAELREAVSEELTVRLGSRWDSAADEVGRTEGTGARNSAEIAAAEAHRQVSADQPVPESAPASDETGGSGQLDSGGSAPPATSPAAARPEMPEYDKVWRAHHDGRTRSSHAAADRQRVPLDAQFAVGAAYLAFPGDPTGPAEEIANCRCAVHVVRRGVDLPAHIGADTETSITASAGTGGTMARTFEALLVPAGVIGRSGKWMLSTSARLVDTTALPLALKWQPSDEPAHDGGVTVAAIEAAELRDDGLWGTGTLLDTPAADAAMVEIIAGVTRPSGEVMVREEAFADENGVTVAPDAIEELLMSGGLIVSRWDAIELVAATLVSVPEFRDTVITVTDTEDATAPDMSLVAAAVSVEPTRFEASDFADPHLAEPTPIHLTADGHVVGHIAAWASIHRAARDKWGGPIHPFHSLSGYSEFHQSHVYLTGGEILRVGRLTVGGGHATPGRGVQAAIAHHDDVSTCWAKVRAGEDDHGIWVSGVVNPEADAAMVKAALGAPMSGHWEPSCGHPELIIAHAVNNPGFAFQAARNSAGELAMVASFAPRPVASSITAEMLDEVARRAVAQYAALQAGQARTAAARELVHAAAGRRREELASVIRESEVRRGVRV